jgi:type II secretory pathway component HofQ
MKRLLPFLLFPVLASAAPKETAEPIYPPVLVADPSARGVSEFSGDPVDIVLRTLARKAKMNLVLSSSVTKEVPGGVTLRLEDKTPKEVIEVICQSCGLLITEIGGVYYINTKFDKDNAAAKDFAHREKLRLDALLAEGFKRDEALQLMLAKPSPPAPITPPAPPAKPAASTRR